MVRPGFFFYLVSWFRLQSDRTRATADRPSPSSNISPFGHQMRVFESAMVQISSFGATKTTGPTHPAPCFVPFGTTVWSAIADEDESASAAASSKRRMKLSLSVALTWYAVRACAMGGQFGSLCARRLTAVLCRDSVTHSLSGARRTRLVSAYCH